MSNIRNLAFGILDRRSLSEVGWHFLKKWHFAFFLAFTMLLFEYAAIFGVIALTPQNHTWLGATISNSSDTGIYLNYIQQTSNSPLLKNFFAGPDHITRFDSFWILGGKLVKLGLTPIQAHEILRIFTTIFLGFAIYATAKSVTNTEKHARITSWLILAGTSTGWIYTIILTITNSWQIGSIVPADLGSEFALSSVLLGGAHMILSVALLLLNTRWLWQIITQNRKISAIPWITITYHVSFHPYYIPIYGLISLFALLYTRTKKSLWRFLIMNFSLLPGAAYYIYLILQDPKLREHHLVTNTLAIDPIWTWLIILLPIIIAYIWILWNKKKLDLSGKNWVWAWLGAAIICIILPLPWDRKFTEALLPALVILTLPFWLHIYNNLKPKIDLPLKAALILLLSFPFLHILQSQFALAIDPAWNQYFYTSNQTINVWNKLQKAPEESLIISTNLYTCLWSPLHTQKYIWIGHNHETPDFLNRFAEYQAWRHTTSTSKFNNFLDNYQITHVLTDKDSYNDLFNDKWQLDYQEQNVSLWSRKN